MERRKLVLRSSDRVHRRRRGRQRRLGHDRCRGSSGRRRRRRRDRLLNRRCGFLRHREDRRRRRRSGRRRRLGRRRGRGHRDGVTPCNASRDLSATNCGGQSNAKTRLTSSRATVVGRLSLPAMSLLCCSLLVPYRPLAKHDSHAPNEPSEASKRRVPANQSKKTNGCARGDAAIARQTAWILQFQTKMLVE